MISVKNIRKSFRSGDEEIQVLKGVTANFEVNNLYSIVGASGSGKSTLLYILSLLEDRDEGEVLLNDEPLPRVDIKFDKELSEIRKRNFSFIFQFFNLMPTLSIEENLELPYILLGRKDFNKEWMDELLNKTGLYDKKKKIVYQLSGGEKQRVGIVRAVMDQGDVVFADEPTGNLDKKNTEVVSKLLKSLAKEYNKSVIMVTHDNEVAELSDRIFRLENGVLRIVK
ncbi:ABC transporter ATP-binding protein [Clostridium perfringens]|uniref:ABC transporter ATP-binding protein n=1 Tax=Clostridium perfringens TaxID=1502 RepID=UPI0039ED5921